MYWVIYSLFVLFENWTYFIIGWLPFYAYFRLALLSYLVLPQTQGARLLYQSHVHPFLAKYEHDIDEAIVSMHNNARKAGLEYLKTAIEFVKQNLLGFQPKEQSFAPPPQQQQQSQGGNYAQNLLSRFNLPSARQGLAAPAGDFYGLLSATMGQLGSAAGGSREAQVESMSRSVIPEGMTSNAEKMTFLSTQRERLRILLTALDKEASEISQEEMIEKDVDRRMAGGMDAASDHSGKSRSGTPFERIEKDEANEKASGGSWMPWNYFAKQAPKEAGPGASSAVGNGG